MDKVRFACPRCQTIMQTSAQKVGSDVVCPHCSYQFQLVEPDQAPQAPTRADVYAGANTGSEALASPKTIDDLPVVPSVVSNGNSTMGRTTILGSTVGSSVHHRPVGFQCPYCQTTRTPTVRSEISQTGWLVFVILLLTTCFGCVIGLFIRDSYRECSQCKIRLG